MSSNNDAQKGKSLLSFLSCVSTGTSTFSLMLLIRKCVVMKLKGAQIHCSHPCICTKQNNTSPTAAALMVIKTQRRKSMLLPSITPSSTYYPGIWHLPKNMSQQMLTKGLIREACDPPACTHCVVSSEDWSSHSPALCYCSWNRGRDGHTSKSTTNELGRGFIK